MFRNHFRIPLIPYRGSSSSSQRRRRWWWWRKRRRRRRRLWWRRRVKEGSPAQLSPTRHLIRAVHSACLDAI
jgi:hypothetical protein